MTQISALMPTMLRWIGNNLAHNGMFLALINRIQNMPDVFTRSTYLRIQQRRPLLHKQRRLQFSVQKIRINILDFLM